MEDQSTPIDNYLLELLDPSTTPEKALQLLSSPCFSHEAYTRKNDPVLIFLAYMRFIIARQPEAFVIGIWEKIFKNIIKYSLNISDYVDDNHIRFTPVGNRPQVHRWLRKALLCPRMCPNPYIRLELFRLIRILCHSYSGNMTQKDWADIDDTLLLVCDTFIHTISEIQPQHLCPSSDEFEILFGIIDLSFIFRRYAQFMKEKLQKNITDGILKQIQKNNSLDVESIEVKFISNCIQLIGTFTVMYGPKTSIELLNYLLNFFLHNIGSLIYSEDFSNELGNTDPLVQFSYVISHLPDAFHPCIIETVCDLTSAIFNYSIRDSDHQLHLRDRIAEGLGVCTNSCDLPGLLLNRQIHGPAHVRKHALLLRHSLPVYFFMRMEDRKIENDEFESDSEDRYSGDNEDRDAEDTDSEESDDEEMDDEEFVDQWQR
ncbi:unnamed protein product [Meganyctiphanes norvegica]|uniref:RNA polymerase I-specific transcription initiation factor RRN3 n=1 Tax=Meganyctiphanes norvegica TaxID=48144 RepID=A0AAV2PQ38_MEGNR